MNNRDNWLHFSMLIKDFNPASVYATHWTGLGTQAEHPSILW